MHPYGQSFATRQTSPPMRALLAATRRQRLRRLRRKLRNRSVGPAVRSEAKPAQLASLSLRAARCWLLTASFAHRSYHALPKTIRRSDGNAAGAIVGFANFLLRFYADERPRAVITGWDSLDAPTKRHEMFPAYQSGREFDEELIEQLNVLPEFVAAFGFANAEAPGFEADDFLAAAVAAEERAGGSALVASGHRDSFQLASLSIVEAMRISDARRVITFRPRS